jgi:pilus assembly protein CpaF
MPVEGYIKKKQTELSENKSSNNVQAKVKKGEFEFIKNELVARVRQKIINKYKADDLNDTEKVDMVAKEALNLIDEESAIMDGGVYLDINEKTQVLEKLIFTMFGYGILDPLIKDPSVTEIMVNGLDNIFIEKNGKLVIATDAQGDNLKFDTPDELMYIVEKIVAPINRKVDDSNPIVDARLPNGFRVNIVLNVISLDGTIITIRKFPESPFTMDNLVEKNALPQEVADFLKKLVKARYNLFVSGGTGSGKTTFLNALSNFINKDERVITIEDAAELKVMGVKNLIRLETRPANVEGKGAITMRDLLKSALRMRPDRIVVGEVRSGEALEMLQAMNTGHDGSLSTGHANTAADMLSRLETMVLMAGVELPLLSIRQQIANAIELIVHLGKLRDGTRRVLQITEILGVTAEGYLTQDLFKFDPHKNKLLYTGNKLKQTHKLKFVPKNGGESELGKAAVVSNFTKIAKKNESEEGDSESNGELFSRFLKAKVDIKKTVQSEGVLEKTTVKKKDSKSVDTKKEADPNQSKSKDNMVSDKLTNKLELQNLEEPSSFKGKLPPVGLKAQQESLKDTLKEKTVKGDEIKKLVEEKAEKELGFNIRKKIYNQK